MATTIIDTTRPLLSHHVWIASLFLLTCLLAHAQTIPSRSPHDWIADAARHEAEMFQYNGTYLRYRIHIHNSHGDQIRDVMESADGTVARLIFKDGHTLTADEDREERARLEQLRDSPSSFSRHIDSDSHERRLAIDMIRLIPDAMNFSFTPGQPQAPEVHAGAPQVVLDFSPNPTWHPPNMPAEALEGVRGRLWIDSASGRMLRLDAELFQGVNFGLGFIAHMYPGGHFLLEQISIPEASIHQRWIYNRFEENVTVRALLVRTLRENNDVQTYDFRLIPAMNHQKAIQMLLDTPLPQSMPRP